MGLFEELKIDQWYKCLVYLGGIIFVLSLFSPVQTQYITSESISLFSLGLFFIGVGEWKCQKGRIALKKAGAYTGSAGILKYKERDCDILGAVLDILGIILLFLSVISVFII